tara:strand:- start:4311 stop:4523 length:213 start_codon:yes stop_codon:yes gene_type:complete
LWGAICIVWRKVLGLGISSDGGSSSSGKDEKDGGCGSFEEPHTGPPSLLQPQQELGPNLSNTLYLLTTYS